MKGEYLCQAMLVRRLREQIEALEAGDPHPRPQPYGPEVDPLELVSTLELEPLVGRLRELSGEIPVEWRAGEFSSRTPLNAMILRLLKARTVGESFAVWEKFTPLITTALVVSLLPHGNGGLRAVLTAKDPKDPQVAFLLKWASAMTLCYLLRNYEDGAHFHRVERRAESFEAQMRALDAEFDFIEIRLAPEDFVLDMSPAVVGFTLKDCDATVSTCLDQELRRRLAQTPADETLIVRVRNHILRDRAFDISQEEICAAFRMEPRTFRRQLQTEGTSLTEILRDLRSERAIYLVRETRTPLKCVADELRYKSAASFNMAFKQWTGQTPGEYRKRSIGGEVTDA